MEVQVNDVNNEVPKGCSKWRTRRSETVSRALDSILVQ